MHSDLPEPLQGTRLATDPLFYFLKAGSVPDRSAAAGKEAHREEITMKRRTAKPPVREMCIFRPEPSEGVIPLPARHRACEGVIPNGRGNDSWLHRSPASRMRGGYPPLYRNKRRGYEDRMHHMFFVAWHAHEGGYFSRISHFKKKISRNSRKYGDKSIVAIL